MFVAARRALRFVQFLLLVFLFCPSGWTQTVEGELDKSPPKGMAADEVIQRFAAKEKQWKQLRELYTFRQSVKVQALQGDEVTGEYRKVADISYQDGKLVKKTVLAPVSGIDMSPEDLQDLETRASFTISTDELPEYNVVYAGQQKEDELQCYVFDVSPKQEEKNKRYFQGRIWVDDQDFQIVRNKGKSVPDIRIKKKKRVEENLFPEFTTWRQSIDGYWFPVFSSADDTLHFTAGDVRIKQVLKFTDYRKK
jgi:hypothetical protein